MPMSSKEAAEHVARVAREIEDKRRVAIVAAKAAAPPDKEALDVDRVKRESRTGALGSMSDDELVLVLEDMYYVRHPEYQTNQELIDHIAQLAEWL